MFQKFVFLPYLFLFFTPHTLNYFFLHKTDMNNSKTSSNKNSSPKKKRITKQLCTRFCRKKLPASQGVKRPCLECPESPPKKFKSTKDRPPTPHLQWYIQNYQKKPDPRPVSPAYRPTFPAYPPTSPSYSPTSPSHNSISSTSLSDADTKILELPSLWEKEDFFGSSDESDY